MHIEWILLFAIFYVFFCHSISVLVSLLLAPPQSLSFALLSALMVHIGNLNSIWATKFGISMCAMVVWVSMRRGEDSCVRAFWMVFNANILLTVDSTCRFCYLAHAAHDCCLIEHWAPVSSSNPDTFCWLSRRHSFHLFSTFLLSPSLSLALSQFATTYYHMPGSNDNIHRFEPGEQQFQNRLKFMSVMF